MTWSDRSYYDVLQLVFVCLALYGDYTGNLELVALSLFLVLLAELRLLRAAVNED